PASAWKMLPPATGGRRRARRPRGQRRSRKRSFVPGTCFKTLPRGLDEGHLVDLAQGGLSRPYFSKRRLAQEAHAFLARRAPYLRCRFLLQNHLAHPVAQVQQFVDGG